MAGIEAAQQRFGKVTLSEVFAPAIRCAEQGFAWALGNAQQYAFRAPVLGRLPETKAIFTKPDGSPYAPGEIFKQPLLAETLRRAAQDGVRKYLYLGEWARKLVGAVQRDGGFMTLQDLADYQVLWTEPARGTYKGYDIYSQGLPSSGGVNLIEAMHLAELAQLSRFGPYSDSPLALYWLAQIAKPAFLFGPGAVGASAATRAAIGELGLDLSLSSRLTTSSAAKLWDAMQSGKLAGVSPPRAAAPAHSDSIVAIDQWGNMAAVVHSINTVAWGATGIFVDGISIPDSASFQQAAIAAAGPGARLPEPTNPGVVLKDGRPFLAFGSIGSGLHIRTVAALISVLDFARTPQQAINEPSLGSFEFGGIRKLTVGCNEFTPQFRQAVSDLGQEVAESDPLRGYWIGIQIDPRTGELHGGSIRELAMGGRAVVY
jgi:gamma-glutamyltranspeptidase/glutathione hydrolase